MITIERARDADAIDEFCSFHDAVYAARSAYWPALAGAEAATLQGEGPFAHGRSYHPLVARRDGDIVARACAVLDTNYIDHWKENLGHITHFEALPDTRDEVRVLMDAASEWLASQGMDGARAGFGGGTEMPFVLDDDDTLPPAFARYNPRYYHPLLKDAGFESEKGWVDYKIRVSPELVQRYESSLDAAKLNGFEIRPLAEIDQPRRLDDFLDTWNNTFKSHWGFAPWHRDELELVLTILGDAGLQTSVLAYKDDRPVGFLFVAPENTAGAVATRPLREDEKLNFLGIGVRQSTRGRGVNMAMASHAYLQLIRDGATYLSYTLVLDDNWPSRRTAEKLGAYVWANYMVYRRNFTGRR